MYDLVVLCVDGHRNAIVSGLSIALTKKREGLDVAVFFTEGAVATIANRKFEWAEELREYSRHIEKALKKQFSTADSIELLEIAKNKQIPLLVCGAWANRLGVADKLPAQVRLIDPDKGLQQILAAKKTLTIA